MGLRYVFFFESFTFDYFGNDLPMNRELYFAGKYIFGSPESNQELAVVSLNSTSTFK